MRPAGIELATLGGETVRVASHGHEAVSLVIADERFGTIARVRLDAADAALLAAALYEHSEAGGAPADAGPPRP